MARWFAALALVAVAGCPPPATTAPAPTGPPGQVIGAGLPPPSGSAWRGDEPRNNDWEDEPPIAVDEPRDEPRPVPEVKPTPAPAAAPEPTPEPAPVVATGKDAIAQLELDIADEINRLRRNPKAYAGVLEKFRSYYNGRLIELPDQDTPIMTFEGVAAVDEAIAVAKKTKPVGTLTWSDPLARAAHGHAVELGKAGTIAHESKDGSLPHERMERYGRLRGLSGENIGTGHGDAPTAVIDLFIDDGVSSRGHRDNLLEPKYKLVGVGCAEHTQWQIICVMDFAAGFQATGN